MECVKCDSQENTKKFYYFDSRDPEVLCWDCRWPIIQERLTGGEYDKEDESDDGQIEQTGLADF